MTISPIQFTLSKARHYNHINTGEYLDVSGEYMNLNCTSRRILEWKEVNIKESVDNEAKSQLTIMNKLANKIQIS